MSEEEIKRQYFGFLPFKWVVEFDGGKIAPIPEYDELMVWVHQYVNEDGFLYPPIVHRVELDSVTMKYLRKLPKTKRPAHLHRVPASHELVLPVSGTQEDFGRSPASFLIHLLSYLFGTRLQFCDWWLDGRVPILEKARAHNISFTQNTAEGFLSHCYKIWKTWPGEEQQLITNILFMHSRTSSYEWDWEQFIIEYVVLDGCYSFGKSLGFVNKEPVHRKRIEVLCQAFGIPAKEDLIKEIVEARNELFHETLWDHSQPCIAKGGSAYHMLPYHLRRLNQRLIPALFGYGTPYVNTKWWVMGPFLFDQPPEK